MSDETYPGGPVMVKIDGDKIRRIRESKGLTQLYVATAVEVTTDTVSRWENKRYPTIKKENGVKLAEALEVTLEEILEKEEEKQEQNESNQHTDIAHHHTDTLSGDAPSQNKKTSRLRLLGGIVTALVVVGIGASLIVFFLNQQAEEMLPEITVRRIVSSHFIAGQPLPVFLHISSPTAAAISIILREDLPPGTNVSFASPEISGKRTKDRAIKWLEKVSGTAVFSYTITSDPEFQGKLSFNGVLKIGSGDHSEITVTGDSSSTSGLHHWADSNLDNRISDEEILAVYELVDPETGSGIDMDRIEEMWLGDGYLWLPLEQRFSIIE